MVFNTLLAVAEQRCRERDLAQLGHTVPKNVSAQDELMTNYRCGWIEKLIKGQGRLHSMDHGNGTTAEALDTTTRCS
jgi:hypothetical protein